MTDFEYGEVVGENHVPRGAFVVSLVNWAGALISVALIAGLATWGYKLWVRDVTGVPVVRALEGPMRSAPEDPGGMSAEHQGLAVNKIAADGQAAPPPDRLVLAPRPITLADEDQSAGELAAELEVAVAAEVAAAQEAEAAAAMSAIDLAIAEALGGSAEAGEPMVQETETLVTASVELADDVSEAAETVVPEGAIPASVAGVAKSPRPAPKPADFVPATPAVAISAEGGSGSVQVIDPTAIPVGTRLAQLGAFDSIAVAEAEWTVLAEQFEDVMGDKGRVIQEAKSGGKTFYRLRAHGFEDINDARRFCSVILATGASCIPVITR